MPLEKEKNRLLLHICCVGCGAYVSELLKNEGYDVSLFFYNPNIFPESEHELRLNETRRVASELGLDLIAGENDHERWRKAVRGHESDPEKGERCLICYRIRLARTARQAAGLKVDYFASTLSVSPHKLAIEINRLGGEEAKRYDITFLDRDFKKQDGFKRASALSRELGLYRQKYCGCEFSFRA